MSIEEKDFVILVEKTWPKFFSKNQTLDLCTNIGCIEQFFGVHFFGFSTSADDPDLFGCPVG